MRIAASIVSMVILSGCSSAGQRPSLFQRMGLGAPPAKKAELLPPVAIEEAARDTVVPELPEAAPSIRPGSLAVEPSSLAADLLGR